MRRQSLLLLSVLRNMCARALRRWLCVIGGRMVAWGHSLVSRFKDDDQWNHRFFTKCFLVDIEVHYTDGTVRRGPLYALYPSPFRKRTLIAKCNWTAVRRTFSREWDYAGATDLVIPDYRSLNMLPNGDAWFSFTSGHAVIFSGEPRDRLVPDHTDVMQRIYEYF